MARALFVWAKDVDWPAGPIVIARPQRPALCPADPTLARSYQRLRRVSAVMYVVAFASFALGAVFAFILPVLSS